MSNRYGESRRRAQLELRAAAAQFMVDAELLARWLDELAGEPAPTQILESRHAEVLRRARAFEAVLNHVVSLELLAAERPAEARHDEPAAAGPELPSAPEASGLAATESEPGTRRTIAIVGDPDKPKPPRSLRDADGEPKDPTAGAAAPDAPEPG